MKKRQWHSGLIIVVILFLATATILYLTRNPLLQVDVPLTSEESKLNTMTLDNGMNLTVRELHATPLVTIQFWVHVGSRNENDDNRGISHIFEHIWFKGTALQPVGSFHKRVETLGGDLNAQTSQDWTMFYVTVPSNKFDDIFPYMTDLLLHPLLNETEITKELQVILEEQRFSFNEPTRFVDDQYGLLLLDKHPYRNPTIGYKNTILNATPDKIKAYYDAWYVPNNIMVVVAGDVNTADIQRKVATAFENFTRKEVPVLDLPVQAPITVPRYNSSTRDEAYAYTALGYLGPNSTDKDRYAMEVLNTIFSGGDSSRMESIIKKQKNLIVSGSSVFAPLDDLGVFEAVATIEPEKRGDAATAILLELNRFRTELVTPEELSRAKITLRANRVKQEEDVYQVGFDIGAAWTEGNVHNYDNYFNNINAVTAEDVQRVAQKYFNAYTLYEVKPKI